MSCSGILYCLKLTTGTIVMTITCFIEYKIDPFKVDKFEQYANTWADTIPLCGGDLLGYFLPEEGNNTIAYGLISFNSLASYESYRKLLKSSDSGKANFEFAASEKFILEEKRMFLKAVPNTYKQIPRIES
jgi:hypothetical protein